MFHLECLLLQGVCWVLWAGSGPAGLQGIFIASGGGLLGQLNLALPVIPPTQHSGLLLSLAKTPT